MKNNEEFRSFYDTELVPSLKDFESLRIQLLQARIINTLLLLATIAAFIAVNLMLPDIEPYWYIIFILPIGFFIYLVYKRYQVFKTFRHKFKEQIIERLVKFVEPSLSYSYTDRIGTSEFAKSKIFLHRIDRASGEDYITGTIGKTQITFSELHMEYKSETTDSNGNHKTEWHTIFKGVFFIADFNKHFNTETIVLPDNWEGLLGRFARRLQKLAIDRGQLIQLENIEFEKFFRVYGHDQIEARYILSPALMERLVNFRKKTNLKLSVSFVDSKIYMALPLNKNLFEPRTWRTNLDFAFIENNLFYLMLFTGIVEELNLNTRIWSKQDINS